MKKMNKLVALLLAAVMVLGMIPTTTAHAHEYHTHGVEEYPIIALGSFSPIGWISALHQSVAELGVCSLEI